MSTRLQRLREMREWIDAEIEVEMRLLGAPLGADSLVSKAAHLYGVAPADMITENRTKPQVAKARHAAAWLLHEAGMSYPQIGKILAYADHTTVLYACRKIDASPSVRALLLGLEAA